MFDPDYLFVDAEEYRVQSLRKLKDKLQIAMGRSEDRSEFCTSFYLSQQVLELSDNDLAKVFQISRPTIGRWCRHEAAPHPIGRGPILMYLLELVEKKLEFYESR